MGLIGNSTHIWGVPIRDGVADGEVLAYNGALGEWIGTTFDGLVVSVPEANVLFAANGGHSHDGSNSSPVSYGDLVGVPLAFAPSAHGSDHGVGGSDPVSLTEGQICFSAVDGHSHDGTDSKRVAWGDVDKAASDIADITGRSHASLTDIGTNTHAEIDTFITDTVPGCFDTSTGHSHDGTDSRRIAYADLTSVPSTFTPSAHGTAAHTGTVGDASQISAATFPGSTSWAFGGDSSVEIVNSSAKQLRLAHTSGSVYCEHRVVSSGDYLVDFSGDCVFVGGGGASSSGDTNTGVGKNALCSNTTGFQNTACGVNGLYYNTTGYQNTACGMGALLGNTEGAYNTGCGFRALYSNTTGDVNTACGVSALYSNTTGYHNTACGGNALASNTNGTHNAACGVSALASNTTGVQNTACGVNGLYSNTTGCYNTACGLNALVYNTTGSYNTACGVGALSSNTAYANCSGLGNGAQVTGDDEIQLGNSATTTYVYGTVQNRSDGRDKTDIRDTVLGLDFINALRPRDFKWDMREDYRPAPPDPPGEDATTEELGAYEAAERAWLEAVKLGNITHDGTHKRMRYHHGLIAQEVKGAMDALGVDFGGYQDHEVNGGDDVLTLGYNELIGPIIKAIQEVCARLVVVEGAVGVKAGVS